MRLLIIADDFTGALDVGVQFAPYNVSIQIAIGASAEEAIEKSENVDVLVVDAETRHCAPARAAAIVTRLVTLACKANVPHLYMKTDSGLRGNVGASLTAALQATGFSFLAFAPAFPDMQRYTLGGIQYNGTTPVHESPFGQDPFEPVKTSRVAELFQPYHADVQEYPRDADYPTAVPAPTIGIFDVGDNADFRRIAQHLKRQDYLKLLAGCAAFASVLPAMLGMESRKILGDLPAKPLLVLCGSLNPITRRQLESAQAQGFVRITLTPTQELDTPYAETAEGKRLLSALSAALDGKTHVILETEEIPHAVAETFRQSDEAEKQKIGQLIATRLGEILHTLFMHPLPYTPMIIGGDTLLGIMRQLSSPNITIEREIEPGVVLFSVTFAGTATRMISKSGSFGDSELLNRMAGRIRQRSEENGLCPENA